MISEPPILVHVTLPAGRRPRHVNVFCHTMPAVNDVVSIDFVEYEVVRRRFLFTTGLPPACEYYLDVQPLEGE